MVHECLVIDNTNFFKNGTIRVRIKDKVLDKSALKDLSIEPLESIANFSNQRYLIFSEDTKEFKYDDIDVKVASPLGGAFDYGIFTLPQPNTYGIVADIASLSPNGNKYNYIWIGGISMFNEMTKTISIPSDKLDELNGYNEDMMNLNDPYSGLVYKQKETHITNSSEDIDDEECKKTLNWESRPTKNMVVIDKDKIWILHNNHDEEGEVTGQSQLILNQDGVNVNFYNEKSTCNGHLSMNNNGSFSLMNENTENNIKNELSANDSSIILSHSDENNDMSLEMGNNFNGDASYKMSFFNKGGNITNEVIMDSKSGITINSNGNISINPGDGGNVTLGTGDGYILTSSAPGTFNLDNHTVTAVKTAKA